MAAHVQIRSSLIKFLNDQIAVLKTEATLAADALLFEWDAHAQNAELPENDLVGTANLSWTNDGAFFDVSVMLGVSTFQDTNMFRHHAVIDHLIGLLQPGVSKIPIVDAALGTELNWLIVQKNGLEVLPVLKTDTRSVQFIRLELGSGLRLDGASP